MPLSSQSQTQQINPGAQDTSNLIGGADDPLAQFDIPQYTDSGAGSIGAPGALSGDSTSGASGGSSLPGLLSSLSSGLSSPIGQLALFGGAAAGLSSQASSAANENNQLATQISAIGQPFVSGGQSELSAYEQGTLTQPFQAQLTSALTANQQSATSQQGAVATALAGSSGGQNVSGALTSQTAAIQNAQNSANQNAVANAFSGELSAATGLLSAGGGFVQQGILTEIQNNQNLQQTMMQIFSGLSSAYAQSTGGGSPGGAGAPGGGGNSTLNMANNVGKLINQFTGASTDTSGLTSSIQGTVNQLGSGIGDNALSGAASDFNNASTFTDASGSSLSDIGSYFTSAGGQAAGAGAVDTAGLTAVSGGDLTALGVPASVTADPTAAAAVDAAGAGGSALGTAIPVAGAVLGAYGTYQGIESGNALSAGLSGAETGAAIGSFIGPEGTIIGGALGGLVGAGGALVKGPHTMENISKQVPNSSVIKLQSGNSALMVGATPNSTSGVAFGAGSSRGQGSANWFLVPATSQRLGNGPSVTRGTPFWIGGQASQELTRFRELAYH